MPSVNKTKESYFHKVIHIQAKNLQLSQRYSLANFHTCW